MRAAASARDGSFARTARRGLMAVVVVVSLALLALWRADSPRLERLRMTLADALLPSIGVVGEPLRFLRSLYRDAATYLDLYSQNRELRREIQQLRAWREVAHRLEEENAQLRAMNNVRPAERGSFVTGDVVADSGGPFRQSVLVNVGRADGVLDGSPAVDGSGLVGRVVGVGEHAARVLLLTDFASRVPVEVHPSRQRGILAGDGTRLPRLEFVEEPTSVRAGDEVRSSGDGGVFPADLPVGRVVAVPGGRWRVALNADYSRLEFVRLLRYRPDVAVEDEANLIMRTPAAGAAGPAPDAPAPQPGG